MGKKVIIVLLILLVLTPFPVFARAGGGSSGGSGGSGGSGSSSSRHIHGSGEYNRNPIVRVASYLGFGSILVATGGLVVYKRRKYAMNLHRDAKEQLDILDDQDIFWNERDIKKKVEHCYYVIQEAWSKQDLDTLNKYLTPSLYEAWIIKLNWQKYKGQRNVLKSIKLLKHDVVSLYDSENDDEDYFWVYIEGKMDDRMIDDQNQIIESNNDTFVEYWKFLRDGEEIKLDMILQQDEFEK
ncbi:Tim44-like domain-containing protein [uncultured Thomasclavelia sp.]|mgnify:CR=1 FL=1|uniref:Tim44 domain-containing protein n=1 Tax=uncultured Thomasclavelia sp. TaxID=3025759 RepID=UPI0025DD1004|nr:Tim44-like domain-containing protein [uncultured Thomasclavelia sp.]